MRYVTAALLVCLAVAARADEPERATPFDAIEREATRVVTWFGDSYAITDRLPDRTLRTRLFDRLSTRVIATSEYRGAGGDAVGRLHATIDLEQVGVEQAAAPARTAAWANGQLRELWRDVRARRALRRTQPISLVTEGTYFRARDVLSRRRAPVDLDEGIEGVAAEYPDGTAVALRDEYDTPRARKGQARSTFTTRMLDAGGREVGLVRWFARERVLTWAFPNGRRGVAMEAKIPGGFTFTPTMAWASVQALGFLRQSARPVPTVPVPALGEPAAAMSVDPLLRRGPAALEPQSSGCDGKSDGCTGLHFLDGTFLRECCDAHDLCFEQDRDNCCEAWSWFFPLPTWRCARCNFRVAWCFVTRPAPGDPGGFAGWGCNGDECERCSLADWCPASCQMCTTRDDPERR